MEKKPLQLGVQMYGIAAIMVSGWKATEMRVRINEAQVKLYAQKKRDGCIFPPADVFYDRAAGKLWVADGFHRILADHQNGEAKTEIRLSAGSFRDAWLFNIRRNVKEASMPFSPGDKTKCVRQLLLDQEIGRLGSAAVAEMANCSVGHVSNVRRQMAKKGELQRESSPPATSDRIAERVQEARQLADQGQSFQEIADTIGVSPGTARRYLRNKPSTHRKARLADCSRALQLILSGVPYAAVAEQTGLSIWTVRKVFYEAKANGDAVACTCCHGVGYVTRPAP